MSEERGRGQFVSSTSALLFFYFTQFPLPTAFAAPSATHPMPRSSRRKAPAAPAPAPTTGPYTKVENSPIHGRGVFARRPIRAGQRLMEYRGERIDWPEALRRHPRDPDQPNHTFYFSLGDDTVIDGGMQGNSARWINHSCAPNCEAQQQGDRVFIDALRDIVPGEELFFDYSLELDARHTPKLKRDYACRCGAPNCRGTLLAPKGRRRGR